MLDVNEKPTGITLSATSVKEGAAGGTVVGKLTTADPDAGETSAYTLSDPSGKFAVSGSNLVVKSDAVLDFEKQSSYAVTVTSTDKGGLAVTESFTLSVLDVANETVSGLGANDVLSGGTGNDVVAGGAGNDALFGGAGNDKLDGGSGNDKLDAGIGNDGLIGGTGNDALFGGAGNDRLDGGLASDQLYGGAGKDTFVFSTKLSSANVDIVRDFVVKDNSIWLDNAVFKKLGSGSAAHPKKLAADAFHIGKSADDAEDRVVYDKGTGYLYYDADGLGGASQSASPSSQRA